MLFVFTAIEKGYFVLFELFQLLDFSINHTERGKCNSDYLKITDWGNKCGYINPKRLPERLTLNRQEVFLEFRSDAKHEARGLWLEFNGKNPTRGMWL